MKLNSKSIYDDGLGDFIRAAEMAGRAKIGIAKFLVSEAGRKTGARVEADWANPKIVAEQLMDKFFELKWGRCYYKPKNRKKA